MGGGDHSLFSLASRDWNYEAGSKTRRESQQRNLGEVVVVTIKTAE